LKGFKTTHLVLTVVFIVSLVFAYPPVGQHFGLDWLYNANEKTSVDDNSATADRNDKYTAPPAMMIDPQKTYKAEIRTNLGGFTVQLFADKAPVTVNNFVFLAQEGFYDDIRFHRIIKDFMIQTGDPLGDGTGGPGYQFKDELPPAKPYAPGVVAMANSGPDTNGSQFFICTGEQAKTLNDTPNYTVFGEVTAGMDVVQKIARTPVAANKFGENSKPTLDVHIQGISIKEK